MRKLLLAMALFVAAPGAQAQTYVPCDGPMCVDFEPYDRSSQKLLDEQRERISQMELRMQRRQDELRARQQRLSDFYNEQAADNYDGWCNARSIAGFGYNEVLESLACR